jgi:hypothetical protein
MELVGIFSRREFRFGARRQTRLLHVYYGAISLACACSIDGSLRGILQWHEWEDRTIGT